MVREIKGKNPGSAQICPDIVNAGSRNTLKIIYTCGKSSISKNGRIRITIPHGFTTPQTTEFYKDGFTTVSCNNNRVKLKTYIVSDVFCRYSEDMSHSGAFGKSLFIEVVEGILNPGDKIEVIYGNTKYYGSEPWGPKPPEAPGLSGEFEFTIAYDPDGARTKNKIPFYILEESPKIRVLPRGVSEIIPLILTTSESNFRANEIHIIECDRYYNPIDTRTININSGDKTKQIKGYSIKNISNSNTYVQYSVLKNGIEAISNPLINKKYLDKYNLYWGDIHIHTNYSDGRGSPEDGYKFSRDVAKLDFCSITDHDDIGPYISEDEWKNIKSLTKKFNKPHRFVTFLGYEYRFSGADMNVYYPGDDGPLMSGKDIKYKNPSKIMPSLEESHGMIIPHMHFGAEWKYYDQKLFRIMEIYSQHGCAEYIGCPRQIPYLTEQVQKESKTNAEATFKDALLQGLKLGLTAGSDSHCSRGWISNWTRVTRTYNGGITGVFAEEKTREAIWRALYSRRCYGTTGPRIYLEFTINNNPMGSEIMSNLLNIRAYVVGTTKKLKMFLIKNTEPWKVIETDNYECKLELTDSPGYEVNGTDFYYIRVLQSNGEMAWSSPIWVVHPK